MKRIALLSVLAVALLSACGPMTSANTFKATLNGGNEVPPVTTSATGSATLTLDEAAKSITVTGSYSGVVVAGPGAHIHGPASTTENAPVLFPLTFDNATNKLSGTFTVTDPQIADLKAGRWYINLHSAANPSGEIRGQLVK